MFRAMHKYLPMSVRCTLLSSSVSPFTVANSAIQTAVLFGGTQRPRALLYSFPLPSTHTVRTYNIHKHTHTHTRSDLGIPRDTGYNCRLRFRVSLTERARNHDDTRVGELKTPRGGGLDSIVFEHREKRSRTSVGDYARPAFRRHSRHGVPRI